MRAVVLKGGYILDRDDLPISHNEDKPLGAFYRSSSELTLEDVRINVYQLYRQEDADFIMGTFNMGQFKTINDTRGLRAWHLLSLARAEHLIRNNPELARELDRKYQTTDLADYNRSQISWIQEDEWLLGIRLNRKPNELELAKDFLSNGNGLRFKLFMLKEYPEMFEER
jgi:hypothetical protein